MRAIAAVAFLLIFFAGVPFPLIVVGAGVIGWFGGRAGWSVFKAGAGHAAAVGQIVDDADTVLGEELPEHARPSVGATLRTAAIWLALWLVPVSALMLLAGPADVFARIATFFSAMAAATFGGAYAVLAYVAQQAVENYHWLTAREMLDGLGMAETTPGPLIMVLQFVGFLAAYRAPGTLPPLLAGTLGGLLATWVTFVPCFLWIFLGAPFIERLRGNRAVAGALSSRDRGGGRRRPEPGDLVRHPHHLSPHDAGRRRAAAVRSAGLVECRSMGTGAVVGSDRCDVPLQRRRDRHPARLGGYRNGPVSGGPAWLTLPRPRAGLD